MWGFPSMEDTSDNTALYYVVYFSIFQLLTSLPVIVRALHLRNRDKLFEKQGRKGFEIIGLDYVLSWVIVVTTTGL